MPPPPPPPPLPTSINSGTSSSTGLTAKGTTVNRNNLLDEIGNFKRSGLKKSTTNDRSAPIIGGNFSNNGSLSHKIQLSSPRNSNSIRSNSSNNERINNPNSISTNLFNITQTQLNTNSLKPTSIGILPMKTSKLDKSSNCRLNSSINYPPPPPPPTIPPTQQACTRIVSSGTFPSDSFELQSDLTSSKRHFVHQNSVASSQMAPPRVPPREPPPPPPPLSLPTTASSSSSWNDHKLKISSTTNSNTVLSTNTSRPPPPPPPPPASLPFSILNNNISNSSNSYNTNSNLQLKHLKQSLNSGIFEEQQLPPPPPPPRGSNSSILFQRTSSISSSSDFIEQSSSSGTLIYDHHFESRFRFTPLENLPLPERWNAPLSSATNSKLIRQQINIR